ncbi:MAG: mannonate dehydratase, partial [Planctomycetaceae bacterium]
MKLATVLTPLSDVNLQLAAQCGVEEVVARYPRWGRDELRETVARVARFGLKVGVVEGYLPIEEIKRGRDDGRELQAVRDLLGAMAELQIPLL